MRSTERPTTRSTGRSEQLTVLEVSVTLEKGQATLQASRRWPGGAVLRRSWELSPGTLTAGLLSEIGEVVSDLALQGLLAAVGLQFELPFEIGQAFPLA